MLLAVDGPPDPVPSAAGIVGDLPGVPEPDVVTVHLLCSCRSCVSCSRLAQPQGERAAPDPHPASRQPHHCRPGSLPAPAVERGPRHPQLGGHLLDRQQRVIRGPGPAPGVAGGRPGAVGVPGGGPSVGPRRRTLRSARRVKSGPRRAGGGRWPGAAAGKRRAARAACAAGRVAPGGPLLPEGKAGRSGRGVVPGGDPVRALAVAGGSGGRPCCRPAGRAGLPPGTAGIHPRLRPPRQAGPAPAPARNCGPVLAGARQAGTARGHGGARRHAAR